MLRLFAAYVRRHHIGLLALFVALSGTAYAATLPRNSVGPRQLKKNAVTSPKIKNGQVRSSDVRDETLTGRDILESSLGQVPLAGSAATATSAQAAQTAQQAADASTLAGRQIKPLQFDGPAGTPDTPLAQAGPLSVSAACSAGNTLTLTLTSTASGKLAKDDKGTLGAQGLDPGSPAQFVVTAGASPATIAFVFTAGAQIVSGHAFVAGNLGTVGCIVAGTMSS